jgi:DNA-binding transcriptional ArsR family regulator
VALRDQDLDVATLAQIAGCRPTVASQHLSKLRLAGLVEATRDGVRAEDHAGAGIMLAGEHSHLRRDPLLTAGPAVQALSAF